MRVSLIQRILITAALVLNVRLDSARAESAEVHVMSFNILQDLGKTSSVDANAWVHAGGGSRRDRAVQVIRDTAPDILGLQEAEQNQVADLTATNVLSAYAFYGFGRDDAAGHGLHDGIFYRTNRFLRTAQGVFWLSETPDAPGSRHPGAAQIRIATWVRLTDRLAGRAYFVMSTHFDHASAVAREYSARLIRERISTLASNMPVIVTGDFNMYPYESAYAVLTARDTPGWTVLNDSLRAVVPIEGPNELTRHAFTGNAAGDRVDYILYSSAFTGLQAGIVRTSYDAGRFPSDHYPVTVTLAIEPRCPRITGFEATGAGFGLEWDAVPGIPYRVMASDDFESWFDAFPGETPLTTTGRTARAALGRFPGRNKRFYRVAYPR